MALACEALGVPIVSGNVSLYNDTDGRSIHPTPVVGLRRPRSGRAPRPGRLARGRRDPARALALAAHARRVRGAGALGLARRLAVARPRVRGRARPLRDASSRRLRRSSTTSSEGGLAVALAEAALWSGVGAELELDDDPLTLFGEVGGQVIVALPAGQVEPDPTGARRRRAADRRRSAATRSSGSPLDELARAHEGTGA